MDRAGGTYDAAMPEELVPERLVAGGDALARDATGRVVFVPGALPGERVEVEIVEERKDFARARVLRVLEASPDRVEAPCPNVARGCGGCDWQHLALHAQREARREIVVEALRRQGRLEDPVVTLGPALPEAGARTTMRFGVDDSGRLGLRERGSDRVVVLDECLIARPSLVDLLDDVMVPGAEEVMIRVSAASGERLIAWSTRRQGGRVAARGIPEDVGVGADAWVHEEIDGVRLRVSTNSFFQASPEAARALVAVVDEAVGPMTADTVLIDAYGGVGLFAATVGRRAGQVMVVESSRDACADARANLVRLEVVVVEVRVEDWNPPVDLVPERTVVVADPAREGLGRRGVEVLAHTRAGVIVLVSCDAAALGRDTRLLVEAGYRHESSVVLDAFVHTHHVEVVTRFVRVADGSRSASPQ